MARYTKSVTKLARNSGGTLDGFPKTESLKREYGSGQHGQGRKKLSEFAIQLKEKQRVKRTYGLLEKQFRRYYKDAVRGTGVTGTLLLQRLESRLDNVFYRSGLAYSRPQGRQLISHGHVLVNGKRVDVPSFVMKPGDVITIRERSKKLLTELQEGRSPNIPEWLSVDVKELTVRFGAIPERQDMDKSINEQLIIEFYSR